MPDAQRRISFKTFTTPKSQAWTVLLKYQQVCDVAAYYWGLR